MAAAVAVAVADSEAGRSEVKIELVVPVPVVEVAAIVVAVCRSTVANGPSTSTSDSGAAVKRKWSHPLTGSQKYLHKPNAALLLVFLRTVPLFSIVDEEPRSIRPPT